MDREEYLRGVASLYAARYWERDWRPAGSSSAPIGSRNTISVSSCNLNRRQSPTATAAGPIRPESRGRIRHSELRCFRGRAIRCSPVAGGDGHPGRTCAAVCASIPGTAGCRAARGHAASSIHGDHEQLVVRIAGREAAGESAMASELVVRLAHPYPATLSFSDVHPIVASQRLPRASPGKQA